MTIDPSRPDRVGPVLLGCLAGHLGQAEVTFAEPPHEIGRGFDTYTYAFRLRGDGLAQMWARPLVVRIFPGAHQSTRAQDEAAVQRFVVERGYAAPRVLTVESSAGALGRPFIVMERASGVPISRPMAAGDLVAVYRLAAATADAHVALHSLPVEGWPLASEGDSVERFLEKAREWIGQVEGMDEPLAWLEAHKESVLREEPAICHNDFQPFNIIADEDHRVVVIDWANADLGDRHQDIADALVSLRTTPLPGQLTTLKRLARRCGRSLFARRYLNRYRQQLPIDHDRLRYWEALRAFGRWSVLGRLGSFGPESLDMKPGITAGAPAAGERALLHRYFRNRMRA